MNDWRIIIGLKILDLAAKYLFKRGKKKEATETFNKVNDEDVKNGS